ncbi:aspartate/glutamate racemase family protein [Streptosporangium sp. DT93]|uniref:aspartate/glutamate racemase family protein n=1 Tax=Streptosporangium sp. DT93 TaxID=3393428 RepID=UPI003CE73B28
MTAPVPEMGVIGLLGGMSWPSTVTYYRELNRAVAARLGVPHSARVLLWSEDYAELERMQLAGEWEAAGRRVVAGALRLEAGGADLLGIACNTMHRVADSVRERCGLPLVDLVEAAAAEAAARRMTNVAVLGTRFTARMTAYPAELGRRGVATAAITERAQQDLDRIIYEELCRGSVTPRAGERLHEIIGELAASGADGVLLACTELNLLVDDGPQAEIGLIDTVRTHVGALVDASFATRPGTSPC